MIPPADAPAFLDAHGWGGARIEPLAGDASFRRYFRVIDEGRQAVFSLAVFDHCGCKKSLTMPNGTKVDVGFFNKPSSILLAEAFKIDNGLIRQVEAVGVGVPYHMRPGWGQ